jgi:hypothetical protein
MWGGSKVPPIRPLDTEPSIGRRRRREQVEPFLAAAPAKEERHRVHVDVTNSDREVESGASMSEPAVANDGSRLDRGSSAHRHRAQVRNGRSQIAMVNGDREHAGDGPRKRDDSSGRCTNRTIDRRSEVDAVMTSVTALGGIGGDHRTGYRCS